MGPENFLYHGKLGHGAFGNVFLVSDKETKNLYAMKIMRKKRFFEDNIVRFAKSEREILG